MKYTLRYLLILPPLLLCQLAAAVTYPSKQGAKVERSVDSEVALQLQQRVRNYRAVSPAKYYSPSPEATGYSGSGVYTGSDSKLNSYGGGGGMSGAVGNGGSHNSSSSQTTTYGGSFSMPRMQFKTEGSTFASTEAPVIASGYKPKSNETFAAPPPPFVKDMDGDGDVDEDDYELWKQYQLPVGNGILTLLLCCAVYGIKNKEQRLLR